MENLPSSNCLKMFQVWSGAICGLGRYRRIEHDFRLRRVLKELDLAPFAAIRCESLA